MFYLHCFYGVDFIKGNFDFLKGRYDDLFPLIDKMECNVFSNPDIAIINGGKYFEDLISIIMVEEGILEEQTVNDNINKLKQLGVINYELKDKFHQARIARNKGVHDNPDKQAFRLCALLFQITVWFYDKYSGDSSFRKPSFDRLLIVEKDKQNNSSNSSNFDEEGMKVLLGDVIDEKMKDILKSLSNNSSKDGNITQNDESKENSADSLEKSKNKEIFNSNPDSKEKITLKKYRGSYLLNELSKLKKSSKESIEDSEGFNNDFKKYMHVDREIQFQLKDKLEELGQKDSAQLIMLAGSVGDGKSHLLSYFKSNFPDLIEPFDIHNDATESFDPNLTAIQTLIKILKPFSDQKIDNSNKKLILAINLGILSDLMEDEVFISKYSKLNNLLSKLNIFDVSTSTNNITSDFLTIINFTDYQLFELDEDGVSSNFISHLLNKVVQVSDDNPFYLAYKKDLELNIKSPILHNYSMLMNDDVQQVIIQSITKTIIKNKKLISTRELLNFIYEILVPAEINFYSNFDDVHDYIGELLPNLLFNTNNRSQLLKDIFTESPMNIRSKLLDEFIISLNTLNIKTVLKEYFEDYDEFKFFKNYLLSQNYARLSLSKNEKPKQNKVKSSLLYYLLFFGNENVKKVFTDLIYDEFIKNLYYYNYKPLKLRKFFIKLNKAILAWSGSIKQDYIIIDTLPNFNIAKRINIDFQPIPKIETMLKNNFKSSISYNVHVNGELCEGVCKHSLCNKQKCIKLNVDYSLFEAIIKINKGYKPNKNEKENLIVFDDFIHEILYKTNNNELLIYYINSNNSNKSFKFRKSSGYYYSLMGE